MSGHIGECTAQAWKRGEPARGIHRPWSGGNREQIRVYDCCRNPTPMGGAGEPAPEKSGERLGW